jgi:hypothetical protein
MLALALAVAACSVVVAGPAAADQTVVSATIYPGPQGSVTHPSVGLQTLTACPSYSGPNPIYLYPGGQPEQLTTLTWPAATVLTCGLQIPLSDVTDVQVLNPSQGFEAPLSSADLSDPAQYQDPQAPGALPVISVDGSENQTTYTRPFRGGTDANARDQVTENGSPIVLVVYANGSPLIVHASSQKLSSTANGTTMKLAASVQTASGAPVPAPSLTWSWNFGAGATSTAATPTHRFAAGTSFVTVQVTDVSTGSGGTATIPVTTPAIPAAGSKTQTGGKRPTKSKSPSGLDNGKHNGHPTGKTGAKHAGSTDTGKSGSSSSDQTTTQPAAITTSTITTSTITTSAITTSATTTTSPPSPVSHVAARRAVVRPRPRHRRPTTRRVPPAAPAGPLVTGRLISDVRPLPAGSSPLVHVTPAAAAAPGIVRRATSASSLSALAAALAVIALLGLGARRELRGRRRWRAAPPGE